MRADDHRHGTNAGYVAGCRADCCRKAHMIEIKRWRMTGPRMVPTLGTRRRVEALEAIGWSRAHQSRLLGKSREYVGHVLRKDVIHPSTAAAIADLYDRLSMVIPVDPPTRGKGTNRTHDKTRRRARDLGYVPPLCWDDPDTDDAPRGIRTTDHRDLLGDWAELQAAGESIEHAATRLGVTVGAIERATFRAAAKRGAA